MPNVGNGNITSFYCAQNVGLRVGVILFDMLLLLLSIYRYLLLLLQNFARTYKTHITDADIGPWTWISPVDTLITAKGEKCKWNFMQTCTKYFLFILWIIYSTWCVCMCKHSTKINVCYFEFKLCFHIAIHDGVLVERCQHYTNRRTNCLFTLYIETHHVALS